ncbi:hypothetical protein HP062_16880 [Pseudomonas sp. B14-6]|uniref:hypothetical protein n=1 Tax=Pseudomonas sp. B14-6 TaxID=2738843 RepID=UPI00155ECFD4|nr:hypothetical protein [Pseudomonas sp. B14-6]QKG67116.1 hypothetical protein HP062_16880 [Pseudomonas sp. B14-6]
MRDQHEVELHSKRLTDFQLRRIVRASEHVYDAPITACLSDVFVSNGVAVGVVFGHTKVDRFGRFADGHFMRTSSIRYAKKEGRFWVLTTLNSRYLVASFKKGGGRATFRSFLQLAKNTSHVPPTVFL